MIKISVCEAIDKLDNFLELINEFPIERDRALVPTLNSWLPGWRGQSVQDQMDLKTEMALSLVLFAEEFRKELLAEQVGQ